MATIALDVFPARLDSPHGPANGVRVLVADNRLLVFAREGRTDVKLDHSANVAASSEEGRGVKTRYTVTDTDGGEWRFWRNGTCSCGSPFKRWSPQALLGLAE